MGSMILGSRLQQWNLLSENVRIIVSLKINYKPEDWRLFIDSLKSSLNAVLMHNDNVFTLIPVGHAVSMKETYANLKQLLKCKLFISL
jgi:hypothetical protein